MKTTNKKGETTPQQVEEATKAIIKDSMKILKNYNLKASAITDIEIGLIPVRKKKSLSKQNYALFRKNLFSLLINRKK